MRTTRRSRRVPFGAASGWRACSTTCWTSRGAAWASGCVGSVGRTTTGCWRAPRRARGTTGMCQPPSGYGVDHDTPPVRRASSKATTVAAPSSGCTKLAATGAAVIGSYGAPVKRVHCVLKYSTRPWGSVIQTICGATSATARKCSSRLRRARSARSRAVVVVAVVSTPITAPRSSRTAEKATV